MVIIGRDVSSLLVESADFSELDDHSETPDGRWTFVALGHKAKPVPKVVAASPHHAVEIPLLQGFDRNAAEGRSYCRTV